MIIFYLYTKTHNITGLKYLGVTKFDPEVYHGSGSVWKAHCKQHGYNVITEVIGAFDNSDDLRAAGLFWSEKWNIVKSNEWANLKDETGYSAKKGPRLVTSSGGPYWVLYKTVIVGDPVYYLGYAQVSEVTSRFYVGQCEIQQIIKDFGKKSVNTTILHVFDNYSDLYRKLQEYYDLYKNDGLCMGVGKGTIKINKNKALYVAKMMKTKTLKNPQNNSGLKAGCHNPMYNKYHKESTKKLMSQKRKAYWDAKKIQTNK